MITSDFEMHTCDASMDYKDDLGIERHIKLRGLIKCYFVRTAVML